MNTTLHLNLKRKWFDMILRGEKKEEYRDVTDYWRKRLTNYERSLSNKLPFVWKLPPGGSAFKAFKSITFSNGYAKDRPQFEIEFKGGRVGKGREEWGADEKGKYYFVLELGEIMNHLSLNKGICVWEEIEDFWETECGKAYSITDGTPKENGMNYCLYCGKRLVEKLIKEDSE